LLATSPEFHRRILHPGTGLQSHTCPLFFPLPNFMTLRHWCFLLRFFFFLM
jgi:hypothetical protein